MTDQSMTTEQVIEALRFKYRYTGGAWVVFNEFRIGTGYGSEYRRRSPLCSPEQRIDLFAMNLWPSGAFERHAIEVKVSRSDWTREIRNPYKRLAAFRLCNRFYFAVPHGMVKKSEVPDGCGLVVVKPGRGARVAVQAPLHESDPPTWMLVAAMARRAAKEAE